MKPQLISIFIIVYTNSNTCFPLPSMIYYKRIVILISDTFK